MKIVQKLLIVLFGLLLIVLAVLALLYFPGYNFRSVEETQFYGSRQMSPQRLEHVIGRLGVNTVINLRGEHPGADWYDMEVEVCRKESAALHNFTWTKDKIPDPESLARFITLIETGKKPILAHCRGGSQETAVAAAVYLLLRGKDTATARKQLGPLFFNAPIGRLVDLYEGSDMPFKQWALEVYPGKYAELQGRSDPVVDTPASALAVE